MVPVELLLPILMEALEVLMEASILEVLLVPVDYMELEVAVLIVVYLIAVQMQEVMVQ
jgi:hypothetical protein